MRGRAAEATAELIVSNEGDTGSRRECRVEARKRAKRSGKTHVRRKRYRNRAETKNESALEKDRLKSSFLKKGKGGIAFETAGRRNARIKREGMNGEGEKNDS